VTPSTYSIAACDLERGEWGVAVASRFLAIGALSAYAEPGVGAIATQAWINASWGPAGLGLLKRGMSAADVAERLVRADAGRAQRQLGIVDAEGLAHSYTGTGCLDWAGHRTGPGYAAQGNMLVSAATLAALADTFEAGRGSPLATRLLDALCGAQAAGGDRRGQQSAALRVVKAGAGYGGADVVVDLRADDHAEPLAELRRLSGLHELYFGATPPEEWVPVDAPLAAELRRHLARRGYDSGELVNDLDTWAGTENLEERVEGADRIDPVVLEMLRRTG